MVKGELLYKNGDSYYGELKNGGEMTGQGVYKFANESLYEGEFINGQFQGKGKLVDKFNGLTIISDFIKGKPHGFGKVIYQDQSIYEGELQQGLRNGNGRYIYGTKQLELQYQGMFKNDQYEGSGLLTFKNGDFCKGNFKNSVLHGIGEIKNKSFNIIGEFKNNLPHGKGRINHPNGQVFEGEFNEGKKHGFGVYTYKDGSIYKGNFVNDLRQGSGQITFSTGEIFKGKFINDQPKQGSFVQKGYKIVGGLKNGEFNGFCKIEGSDSTISVDFNEGKKDGFLTMVKQNQKGKQVTFKSEFKRDKENPLSISYSQRF